MVPKMPISPNVNYFKVLESISMPKLYFSVYFDNFRAYSRCLKVDIRELKNQRSTYYKIRLGHRSDACRHL